MEIKDGDYFSYSWKVGKGPNTDPYWCRDGRCVARQDEDGKIRLIDTFNYWPFTGRDYTKEIFTYEGLSREYSKYLDLDRFDLEFICNLNDYEYVKEYDKDDYEGVIFVGYQCTKLWAKPKGSQKSNKAIMAKLEDQLAYYKENKRSAEVNIEWVERQIQDLKSSSDK